MTGGRPGAPGPAEDGLPDGDLLEGGSWQPPAWRRWWRALPRRVRHGAVALGLLGAAAAAGLWLQDRAADRALEQRIALSATLGVWSTSSAPQGGRISWFVVVANDGRLPLRVTGVEGSADGLRIAVRDGAHSAVAAGGEVSLPLSIRLTCARHRAAGDLDVSVTVRRADGEPVTRRVPLEEAGTVLGVASSLCRVRPATDDRELSGPVLAGAALGSG
jgi:hypothetical protein